MIELCSLRRFLIAGMLLILLSVMVILLENRHIRLEHDSMPKLQQVDGASPGPENASSNKFCWLHENYTINKSCAACSKLELSMKEQCSETGFIEKIHCEISGTVTRWCRVPPTVKSRAFWLHECISCCLGGLSFMVVHLRRKKLDQALIDKVNRQIAAGV